MKGKLWNKRIGGGGGGGGWGLAMIWTVAATVLLQSEMCHTKLWKQVRLLLHSSPPHPELLLSLPEVVIATLPYPSEFPAAGEGGRPLLSTVVLLVLSYTKSEGNTRGYALLL